MKYAVLFIGIGLLLSIRGAVVGGPFYILIWPGISLILVGLAYASGSARVFGKQPDGHLSIASRLVLFPFLFVTWMTWHFHRWFDGAAGHEIVPGLWLGRRAKAVDLPPAVELIVDLTCEFPRHRSLNETRSYATLPTLDAGVADDLAFSALVKRVADCQCPVYIHCALGNGRSASVVAAVLIARGIAMDVELAEALIRRSRPTVKLNLDQRGQVRRIMQHTDGHPRETAARGLLLGMAVGDAIGLPREGLSARRARRLFGDAPLSHRFILRRGMMSDDTEHACMTAQALLASHGSSDRFVRSLAWRLRGWIIVVPAGVGLATAKASVKLWLGFPPYRSGVWSAGNGPAMRSPLIGFWSAEDVVQMKSLVAASTRLTHTDPDAEQGAFAIALAVSYAMRCVQAAQPISPTGYLAYVRPRLQGTPVLELIEQVIRDVNTGLPFHDYLRDRGLERGISGYINHTVPACIYSWLLSPTDYRAAVERVILAGGDTDTTGAIVGALVGVVVGTQGIPTDWLRGLVDRPRTSRWMESLATRIAFGNAPALGNHRPLPLFWPGLFVRNPLFLLVVLVHGVRRLLPPY